MLDTDTKRRIDTARDILVGKVPDPKSQVEQITIALIYKFMDDIDAESEEWGGEREFFAGDFSRYGWTKLMHPGMGGHETLNLYAEAITRMPENAGIPPLFRDIFNNAYLPYRDPETLRAFLKIIDGFNYDHSERLGDAFEYLLSVLGSQGDAGQFRTPRHIIDFMVAIIDPKKDDVVLDPACGTAGFLISSYKHIMAANSGEDGHNALSPDERSRLADSFRGYDISPDMVRLSLVNMYPHGFAAPHIFEYDTLTSEDRWNEYADVILANPPFMSPKGGIRPHNRFSVKSKRSEVLFVDYMAEHLTANGRAGIIVPEGIIFQSQNAYKQLRRMLVEDYLVAVVSLPAGVFKPYSGVKTSILILDRTLARRADGIALFKVDNDGFDLGDQRRPIAKNELPQVHAELAEYLNRLRAGEEVEDLRLTLGWVIPKEQVAVGGEYNLSGDRYRQQTKTDSIFPFVDLKTIAQIAAGNPAPQGQTYFSNGQFPFVRTPDVGAVHRSDHFVGTADRVNQEAVDELGLRLFPASTILFPKSGASTFLNHRVVLGESAYVASHLAGIICNEKRASVKYVYRLLCKIDARSITPDQAYPSLRLTEIENIKIPLPPLDVQWEIVAEIDGYQKIIDGARAVVDNYRPYIAVDPAWPMVSFSEAPFQIIDGDRGVNYPKKEDFSSDGYCVFLNTTNVRPNGFNLEEVEFITKEKDDALRKGKLCRGDAVLTTRGTVGNTGYYDNSISFDSIRINSGMLIFRPDENELSGKYLFHFLQSKYFKQQREGIVSGTAQPQLPIRSLNAANLPLPALQTQQAIVAEIETEQALVDANRELVRRFEGKIQAAIARVWGHNSAAAKPTAPCRQTGEI